MSKTNTMDMDVDRAYSFLTAHFGASPSEVTLIGEGAWSRCYGFRHDGRELAVRFGHYVDDFEKDRLAYAYAGPGLPIPEVLDIGQAFDGYYAIATRVHGVPLESLDAGQWRVVVPSLAAALEAMRTADLSGAKGFGGWGNAEMASHTCWSDYLLAVADDTPDQRGHGWKARLATRPGDNATFTWGYELLKEVVSDAIPRCLIHGDLINRNVLVDNRANAHGAISGIFDWGCSKYGDHLYDLAWFEFWASWYPELDMQLLRSEIEEAMAGGGLCACGQTT